MRALKFTPYAWAKLVFLRDRGKHEISCFGITEDGDSGTIVDVETVKQKSSVAYTEFFEDSLADYFEKKVEEGLQPENFARIWCHTHPGNGVTPSLTDEECFRREFSAPDWAIMFILGTEDATSCRLKFNVGPGGSVEIPSGPKHIDWSAEFRGSNIDAWEAEYDLNIKPYLTQWANQGANQWANQWGNRQHTNFVTPGCGVRIYDKETNAWVDKEEYRKTHPEKFSGQPTVNPTWKEKAQQSYSPIGFYQQQQVQNLSGLTKREKKYYKKHGTLKGFIHPKNTGIAIRNQGVVDATPNRFVNRNFCNDHMSDEEVIDEVFDDLRQEIGEAWDRMEVAKGPQEEHFIAQQIDKLEEEWACVCKAVGREVDWEDEEEASDTELEDIEGETVEIVEIQQSSELGTDASDELWLDELAEAHAIQKGNEAAMDSELQTIPYVTEQEEVEYSLLEAWPVNTKVMGP